MPNPFQPTQDPKAQKESTSRVNSRERIPQVIPDGPRMHLGCGLNTPDGWTHIDGSWNAWFSKFPLLRRIMCMVGVLPKSQMDIKWDPRIVVKNITRGLPAESDSQSAVYASHLLEHLYLEEQKALLEEIFRVLKPGGVFRAVVPDLRAIVDEYMGGRKIIEPNPTKAETRADLLNLRLGMRHTERPKGSLLYRIYRAFNDLHSHKWMYDAESLSRYFEHVGFTRVSAMPMHKSSIPGIESIEQPSRVENGQGICIEGFKPHWN